MSDRDNKLYQVIIEWDGRRPPTRWYRWLKRLTGMSVRQQGASVIKARMNDAYYGVVVQEGCIRCGSYSLARTIYFLVKQGFMDDDSEGGIVRPAYVAMSEVTDLDIEATPSDIEALNLMAEEFGKKGRRKGEPTSWAVCCFEDLASYETESYAAINCPHCGGMQVRVRQGEMNYFADPGGPILSAWMRMRFATGQFEIPRAGSEMPPERVDIKGEAERNLVGLMINSPILGQIEHLDRETAFHVLDAALVTRLYWADDRRRAARVQAATKFYEAGGNVTDAPLRESRKGIDILDAAGPIGTEWAASVLHQYVRRRDGAESETAAPARNPDAPVMSLEKAAV